MQKYGMDNFKLHILAFAPTGDITAAVKEEQRFMDEFKPHYNKNLTAGPHTPESIAKSKEKERNVTLTDEQRQAMSEQRTGEGNPFFWSNAYSFNSCINEWGC